MDDLFCGDGLASLERSSILTFDGKSDVGTNLHKYNI